VKECIRNGAVSNDLKQGAAWLSSARAVRCWVKSRNERNPCGQLPARYGGDSGRTACASREEGGDDVKSSWPLRPGRHTCYNGRHSGQQAGNRKRIHKAGHSSDWGLQLDPMKLESLVIAHQPWRGEYVPGPCTHRPSSHGSREDLKLPLSKVVRVGLVTGAKS
jgi:hypothetical protein